VPPPDPAREWGKISPQSAASKIIMVRTLGGTSWQKVETSNSSIEFALALGSLSVA
jgi:hypothetical protein